MGVEDNQYQISNLDANTSFFDWYTKENDEVIREIPTEEFREVAKALEEFADKLSNKGLLFDRTA